MSNEDIRYPNLREIRSDHKMTQEDMGKLLNCTQSTYSHYETGDRDIPSEQIIRLAKYFNCSTDYLLGLTNIRTPKPVE